MTNWTACIGYWYRDANGRAKAKQLFIETISANSDDEAQNIACDRLAAYLQLLQHPLEILSLVRSRQQVAA